MEAPTDHAAPSIKELLAHLGLHPNDSGYQRAHRRLSVFQRAVVEHTSAHYRTTVVELQARIEQFEELLDSLICKGPAAAKR